MSIFKKTVLAGALAATTIASATPAMARDHRSNGDDTAAIAIGAGILGLALGAIIASDNRKDRYYDTGYAYGPAYVTTWQWRDGYYWDRDGRRHTRDEYARYARAPQNGSYRHDGYYNDRQRGYNDQRRGY